MNFLKKAKDCVIKKAVPLTIAGVAAMNALAVNVFASETPSGGGSGLDVDTITSSMQSSLTDLVTKAGIACAAVIGVGLSIFAGKWLVTTIKNFFTKVAK